MSGPLLRVLVVGAGLTAALVGGNAIAQSVKLPPPPPPPPPPSASALEAVEAAHPTAGAALELGRAYRREKRIVEAIEAFDRALARQPDRVVESNATRDSLELRREVATLEIFCDFGGTKLEVDGKSLGEPLPGKTFYLLPGPHEVLVSKEGKTPYRETIGAAAGATIRIEARLGEPGVQTAQGPPPKAFVIDRLGQMNREDDVAAPAGPPSDPIYKRWWFWTLLGVAAAGGGSYLVLTREKDPYCGTVKPCATAVP